MCYTNPIDSIVIETIECKKPYHLIALDDFDDIISENDINLSIKCTNLDNIIFTIEGIESQVLKVTVHIYKLIKISMEIPGNKIYNFLTTPYTNITKVKTDNHTLRANNHTLRANKYRKSNTPYILDINCSRNIEPSIIYHEALIYEINNSN